MSIRVLLLSVSLLSLFVDLSYQRSSIGESSPDIIPWKSLKDLSPEFLHANKRPIMVLVHKSWSPPCKMLVDELHDLNKSKQVKDLSKKFVMVNVVDSDEPSQNWLAPDGVYYPRILFLNPAGELQPEFTCNLNMHQEFKYYYSSAIQVSNSMERVLLGSTATSGKTA